MSFINKITNWINKPDKPVWWRHSIRLAAELGKLGNNQHQLMYEIAKMEVGIIDKSPLFKAFSGSVKLTGLEDEDKPVSLIELSNVQNVSTLIGDKSVKILPTGLNVIYGDNGAGKSSYAKILKNACLTRGDKPEVIPDIFSIAQGSPQANLTVKINESTNIHTWIKGCEPIPELKSIRVFDSQSANHYLSKEDVIDIKPVGINLLDELIGSRQYIKRRVEEDKRLETPLALPQTTQGTLVNKFITQISCKTEIKDIDNFDVSSEEELSLPEIKKEIISLSTKSPEEMRNSYKSKRQRLEPFLEYLNKMHLSLNDEAIKISASLFDLKEGKHLAAETIRKQTFDRLPVNGVGTTAWIMMWKSVEKFVANNGDGRAFPPAIGDHCPTCLQDINDETSTRLQSFSKYLTDKTQREADKANLDYENSLKNIKSLSFNYAPYKAVLASIKDYNEEQYEAFIELIQQYQLRADNLLCKNPIFNNEDLKLKPLTWLTAQVESLKSKEAMVKDDKGITGQLIKLQSHVSEIEDKIKVTNAKEAIIFEINRRKIMAKLGEIEQKTNPASITRLNTEISQSGSIGELNDCFIKELDALGFKHFSVQTNTRGSKGKQLLKVKLPGKNNKITDIASEGEQKCIALAMLFGRTSC